MTKKYNFFEGSSWFKFNKFGTDSRYFIEILRHCDRKVKTKSQKVWGLILPCVEVTGEN